jgi:hypothetical protein
VQRTQSFAGVRGRASGGCMSGSPKKLLFPFFAAVGGMKELTN